VKLVLFSDLEGRPIYVNIDSVTHLTKLAEDQTVINFERDYGVKVRTDIQTAADTLDPQSGPTE
jgi:hypothetical protein